MSDALARSLPLFVGGHRKCGTTLFASLLDHHPDLFVYPGESGFFYKFFPILDRPEKDAAVKQHMIDCLLHDLNTAVEKWVRPGRPDLAFSIQTARRLFQEKIASTGGQTRDYYHCLVNVALELLEPNGDHKYWIDKTTSIEIYADTLFEWYPNARFIHILRDPRDNYGSIKSGWEKEYRSYFDSKERLLQSVIDRGKLGMEMAERNLSKFGSDRYLLLRFEDLVGQTEHSMKIVCDFLNIQFQPILLKPTFGGVAWAGNNFENQLFRGVSSQNSNRWRERIEPHEAQVLEYYFSGLMEKYGYQPAFSREDQVKAAVNHYKWSNYAQTYSFKIPPMEKP